MKIIENKNYIQMEAEDENGEFHVRLLKKGPFHQLHIESFNGDQYAWVEVDRAGLIATRDMINKVLDG
jgi:hypothetical protein